ncbi:MAG: hypothetical protein GY754_10495 [bacterium]|nr:hypothetical protein [bacterium]
MEKFKSYYNKFLSLSENREYFKMMKNVRRNFSEGGNKAYVSPYDVKILKELLTKGMLNPGAFQLIDNGNYIYQYSSEPFTDKGFTEFDGTWLTKTKTTYYEH